MHVSTATPTRRRGPGTPNVAPVSLLVVNDVKGGREHLNFSQWDRPQPSLDEVLEERPRGGDAATAVQGHPQWRAAERRRAPAAQGRHAQGLRGRSAAGAARRLTFVQPLQDRVRRETNRSFLSYADVLIQRDPPPPQPQGGPRSRCRRRRRRGPPPRPAFVRLLGTSLFELSLADDGAHAAGGWRTTQVLHAPRRFDLMGLRWKRGGRLERRSAPASGAAPGRRGCRCTPPATTRPTAATPPRAPSRPTPARPTSSSSRLRSSARGDPRARFVRAQPTARTARHLTGRARRKARVRVRARSSQSSQPLIITRTEWGGEPLVPPRSAPEPGQVQAASVHHTVKLSDDDGPEESAGIVLGIARYHRDSNGWNDIGYNFLVDQYGQVFEGRAGGIDQAVIGAQAQGYNSASTGIATIGTFTSVPYAEAGMDALARLIGWKLSLHAVPTQGQVVVTSRGGSANRYPSGTPVTLERICAHRDGDSTSRPGNALYAQLPDLRARAARYSGPLAGITVRAATRRIRTRPVQLSGELRFPDGSSPAGAPLQIQFAVPGATFAHVADAVCGPDGSWAATVPLTNRLAARRLPRRRDPAAAGLLPHRDPRPAAAEDEPLEATPARRPQRRRLRHRVAEAGQRPRRGADRAPRRPPLAAAAAQADQRARRALPDEDPHALPRALPRLRAHAGRHPAPPAARPRAVSPSRLFRRLMGACRPMAECRRRWL